MRGKSLGKLQKVYLPKYVLDVFDQDMEVFNIKRNGKKNLSRFCNLVFSNMKDEFLSEKIKMKNLFVDKWLKNKLPKVLDRKYYLDESDKIKLINEIKNQFDDVLQVAFKTEKMKYHDYISFRLNNENALIFESIERQLGGSFTVSDYFRNMFLTYTLKPKFEREKIVFREYYDLLVEAIKNKNKIEVEVFGVRRKIVNNPCFIKENIEGSYNYVVCLTKDNKIKSPRLSSIESLVVLKGTEFDICEEKKSELNQLKENFDPFLNGVEEVKIRLSKRGRYKFKRMVHNRPSLSHIEEDDIYVFYCSPEKIRAYFFKFGEEAIVLEPKTLVKEFRKEYLRAYRKYASMVEEGEKEKRKRLKVEYKRNNES